MENSRRSSNLRCRKREARSPLGVILILYVYLHKKSHNASSSYECENREPIVKRQGIAKARTASGELRLLVVNIPKRLGPLQPFRKIRRCRRGRGDGDGIFRAWLAVKGRGSFSDKEAREVESCGELQDVSVSRSIQERLELVMVSELQLVSAEQGRKRLVHKTKTNSAPLRQRRVPRCR